MVINGILSKLPIGSGKEVTMECTDDREVHITSGRTKARIRTLDKTYYSFWNPFENAGLQLVENLGEKIKLVEWAADPKQNPPLAGVHITGTSVIATDRVRFASVPCDAPPITRPITIPLGVFDPLIKSMADCVIGISQGQLWLMPDEFTQIRAVIFADKYPNIERAMKRDHDFLVEFEKQDLIDMIERASVISTAAGDRIPLLKLFIGREEIAVMMEDQELGLLGDVIEVPGFANHNRIILGFAPENLLDPLRNSPGDKITLHYGESYKVPIRFVGGSGYEVWVAGRNV